MTSEDGEKDKKDIIYYSVFVPGSCDEMKSKTPTELSKYIFTNRPAAISFMKDIKKARFRQFSDYNDAIHFASYGSIDEIQQQLKQQTNTINDSNINKTTNITSYGEKGSPFKGPKPQDMVKLRKAIENGDYSYVRTIIWENPRYLISSGDTPSILQEGFRYNALHVAAKFKRATIVEIILNTITDDRFIKLLYGDDVDYDNIENRIQALLDLYLNTPDKGSNETPLHFAVKFGAVDVVEILVSFPQCDKQLKNKYGQTPDMIICDRCDKKDSSLQKKIEMLLKNNFYVPVLRADDNSIPPRIGEPFSPGGNPVIIKNDPLSPRLEIHAYAGPMNKEGAEQFRKIWKTPPRTNTSTPKKLTKNNNNNNNNNNDDNESFDNIMSLRYKDHLKGLERLGQKLAYKYDVNWKEYWPFLDCFIDISSNEGLQMLENHLKFRSIHVEKSNNFQLNQNESISNNINNSNSNCSTISDLCNTFQRCCNLNDSSDTEITNDNFSPFLCIEKACDVFANRLLCDIINRITTITTTTNSINLLINHMKQIEILTSYMEDQRFKTVNFKCLHYRLGQLISEKLQQYLTNNQRKDLLNKFEQFLTESIDIFDYSSSDNDRDSFITTARDNNRPTSLKKQLVCLIDYIYNCLNDNNGDVKSQLDFNKQTQEEIEFINIWNNCKECDCIYHIRKSRKTTIRNNSFKYKSKTYSNFISRKLFNNDVGDDDVDDKNGIKPKSNDSREMKEHEDRNNNNSDDLGEDNDEFYTPPSSPSQLYNSDDEFSDTQLSVELFIDGDLPTKTDCAVFNALRCSNTYEILNPKQYPYIYRWYHNVNLYSDTERENWPVCNNINKKLNECSGTPSNRNQYSPPQSPLTNTPPSKSWLRITGVNSPTTKFFNKQSPRTIFSNHSQKNK